LRAERQRLIVARERAELFRCEHLAGRAAECTDRAFECGIGCAHRARKEAIEDGAALIGRGDADGEREYRHVDS
jgi:hypothetical protein